MRHDLLMQSEFTDGFEAIRDQIFRDHEEIVDHRRDHPWLTGALGDLAAPVWFVAENPSLSQVEKLSGTSVDLQWSISPGDQLFRRCLVDHGFKTGTVDSPGGWRCYITDVIKSADYVNVWRAKPDDAQRRVAGAWAPLFAYELEHGNPKILVILGGAADKLITHLRKERLIPPPPPRRKIPHYSYIAMRPDGRRGPMHPERVAEWSEHFRQLAAEHPPNGDA